MEEIDDDGIDLLLAYAAAHGRSSNLTINHLEKRRNNNWEMFGLNKDVSVAYTTKTLQDEGNRISLEVCQKSKDVREEYATIAAILNVFDNQLNFGLTQEQFECFNTTIYINRVNQGSIQDEILIQCMF